MVRIRGHQRGHRAVMMARLYRLGVLALAALAVVSLAAFLLSRALFPAQLQQELALVEQRAQQELALVERRAQQELALVKDSVVAQRQMNKNGKQQPDEAAAAAGQQPGGVQPNLRSAANKNSDNLAQQDAGSDNKGALAVDAADADADAATTTSCPYASLSDLTEAERHPAAGPNRHMVTPPAETSERGVALVCCTTTAGPLSIAVHHAWAPFGARRFLDLVEAQYFDTTVPLMRCVRNFLCQFGLNGVPSAMKPFQQQPLPDDPNWLPEGAAHRQNELGVQRFQRGYLAYAGSGPRSRSLQLIVALRDNGPLAGGSPWEVPWGELVGPHSYQTLDRIYTGYGEKGPKQASLWKVNALERVRQHFPKLDYIQKCRVVDRAGGQGVPGSTRADYVAQSK